MICWNPCLTLGGAAGESWMMALLVNLPLRALENGISRRALVARTSGGVLGSLHYHLPKGVRMQGPLFPANTVL